MMELTDTDRQQLLNDIATRAGTAKQIASWYEATPAELRAFVEENRSDLEAIREETEREPEDLNDSIVTPTQLDDLWVTNKFERLKRYQQAADLLFLDIQHGKLAGAELATSLREFRSYLTVVANELGQLLHRGSGDAGTGDTLSVDFQGVDVESLR